LRWRDLEGSSPASIDEAVEAGLLARSKDEASHVVDPRYGSGPIPVVYRHGRYYLHLTDPDGPAEVEVPAEHLKMFELETECVLEALAKANEIEPAVRHCASGLWIVGHVDREGDEHFVLFAPVGLTVDLVWAIEEARATLHFDTAMLLTASPETVEGSAMRLKERGVTCYVLPEVLGDDLTLRLPAAAPALLEVDAITHTARWRGQRLDLGDTHMLMLEELVRGLGEDVSMADLCNAGGLRREDQDVRKSIMLIRRAILAAGDAVGERPPEDVVKNVRGVGYTLALQPWQVNLST